MLYLFCYCYIYLVWYSDKYSSVQFSSSNMFRLYYLWIKLLRILLQVNEIREKKVSGQTDIRWTFLGNKFSGKYSNHYYCCYLLLLHIIIINQAIGSRNHLLTNDPLIYDFFADFWFLIKFYSLFLLSHISSNIT